MAKVLIPPPFRGPTRGEGQVDVDAATVRACIEAVEERFRGFRDQVLDVEGRPHRFVTLFRNGDQVDPAGLDAPVGEGDEVQVLAAVAGGAGTQSRA